MYYPLTNKGRVQETTKRTGLPKKNKTYWHRNKHAFLPLHPHHLSPSYALLLWWILPKQTQVVEESPISRHSLPSPYLSLPLHPLVFLWLCHHFSCSRSLSVPFFSTLSSSPLHMWISFSLIIMTLGSASVAAPLKPGRSSSSSNAPFFSSEFKQPHKMASTLHMASRTKMVKQLLCSSCLGLISRNSVVHQGCEHRLAEWPCQMPSLAKLPQSQCQPLMRPPVHRGWLLSPVPTDRWTGWWWWGWGCFVEKCESREAQVVQEVAVAACCHPVRFYMDVSMC